MWNQRYSQPDYVFGKQPNDFLVAMLGQIPHGRVLCLGDGEGRNGVYLAQQGYKVTAVDASPVGLAKAQALATERGVNIETITANLADFAIQPDHWDAIVSIFCHLPPPLRNRVHQQVVTGLRSGGVFVLEAYTPRQLFLKTGGPPTADLMMDLPTLQQELTGLVLTHGLELERQIQEGKSHNGRSAVVQVVAVKPTH